MNAKERKRIQRDQRKRLIHLRLNYITFFYEFPYPFT